VRIAYYSLVQLTIRLYSGRLARLRRGNGVGMALISAQLHGGPLDGELVAIQVDDPNDPPRLHDIGYRPQTTGAPAVFFTYRRTDRNPVVSIGWDYEHTGETHTVPEPP